MDIQRQIKEIEKQAHHGGYGLWRKSFCREYLKLQKEACVEAREELLSYLDSIGQHITCRMGCAHCCSQYISISVSNGIVIVDYLYSNPRVLEKFLRNYEKWLRIMDSGIENTRILRKLEEYTSFSPVVKPNMHSSRYHVPLLWILFVLFIRSGLSVAPVTSPLVIQIGA
jgi:hypothetical protein